jgi:hypothetical protein
MIYYETVRAKRTRRLKRLAGIVVVVVALTVAGVLGMPPQVTFLIGCLYGMAVVR